MPPNGTPRGYSTAHTQPLLHLPESENATLELSMYCVTAAISSLMIALAFMTCREMIM